MQFSGHSHSGSGVIMILVCHMISQDHVTKELCDFTAGSPPLRSIFLHHSKIADVFVH